jgi:hypothetical protein
VLTHFLVVADQDRSREFCRALFGTHVLSERDPVILKVASRLVLNTGGDPTEDKPTISCELAKARKTDLRHQAQRDARARAARRARRTWMTPSARRCSPPPRWPASHGLRGRGGDGAGRRLSHRPGASPAAQRQRVAAAFSRRDSRWPVGAGGVPRRSSRVCADLVGIPARPFRIRRHHRNLAEITSPPPGSIPHGKACAC